MRKMMRQSMRGALRQPQARALAAELCAAVAEGDVTLDLSDVEQVDLGILQVFIAASTMADALGNRLYLHIPPESPVCRMVQALGLPLLGMAPPLDGEWDAAGPSEAGTAGVETAGVETAGVETAGTADAVAEAWTQQDGVAA